MLNLRHKNLDVWKKAVEFVSDAYKTTETFSKTEQYGLTNQIRRAAVSIPSNIAEGASRTSLLERKRCYEIARSSLVEIDTQMEIAIRLTFCSNQAITPLSEKNEPSFRNAVKFNPKHIIEFENLCCLLTRLTFDF
ncbi:MAG: four helix bundle protein [bacterium]